MPSKTIKRLFLLTFFLTLLLAHVQPSQFLASNPQNSPILAQAKPAPSSFALSQPLTLYQPLQHLQWEGRLMSKTGIAYFTLDGLSDKPISESDLDIIRSSHDSLKLAEALSALGVLHHSQGEYDKAIDFYKQGLVIAKEIGNTELETMLLGDLGLAHVQKGDYYADAIEYLNDYLNSIRSYGSRSNAARHQEAQALGNLANAYYGADLYAKAIALHQKRLTLSRQINDRSGEAKAFSDLGIIYQALGNTPKAIDHQQQALTLARQIKDQSIESLALGHLGIIYQAQGNYEKALKFQHQRLTIARELNDLRGQAEALGNLAGTAYLQSDYQAAIGLYDQGWKIAWETLHDADILYRIRGNQGLVYFQMGNYDKALEYYGQYFQYAASRSNRREQGIAKLNAAAVRSKSGNLAAAAKTLQDAIGFWESLRARLGSNDGFKVSIFETQNAPYNNLQTVLVAQNQPEAALEISERGRARAYAELLARRDSKVATQNTIPQTLPSPTIEKIRQIARSHQATLVEYSIISENFNVQEKLEAHESELLIWVVQPTGNVTLRRVDLKPLWQCQNAQSCDPTTLGDLVTTSRQLLQARSHSSSQDTPPTASQTEDNPLHDLHQLLIQPIADLLPTDPNAHVIFVPQRSLFLVPFAALQDKAGKFLIEQHVLSIAPSIQVLELTQQHRQKQSTPKAPRSKPQASLVVGNPTMPKLTAAAGEPPEQLPSLPGAEHEAQTIAHLLNTSALVGKAATKSTVVQQMGQARLVHLATHGLLSDFRGLGMPGAIALAPDLASNQEQEQENGILTASEILDLHLSADLVVLSACNTGRGKITGDGVVGLSRALMGAGIPSVVVSLWSVPDESTALLMTEFYRNLQHQAGKSQALRQAMLTTLQKYPDPLDWAAFMVMGETE